VIIGKVQLKQLVQENIPQFYSQEEKDSLTTNFICGILEISVTKYLIESEFIVSETQNINLKNSLENLRKGKPLQYIFGNASFFGREFLVTPDVLIPRPETEELCNWIIEETKTISPKILDIGCGSGNIPITLNLEISKATVFAIDISKDALLVAKENSKRNNAIVQFEQMDILNWKNKNVFSAHKFDIIVSNPPYILEQEKTTMRKNVLDFEPHLALFVKNNPMLFYQTIAEFAKEHLNKNGKLFFEINEAYFSNCKDILEIIGYKNVELRKDFGGKFRMIKGELFAPNF